MKTSPPDEASPAGAGRASLRGFACGFLLLVPTLLQAGIASTKHNLTGTEDGPVMNVCVFCHTPAGDPSAAAEPTWTAGTVASGETTFTTFDDLGRLDPNSGNVAGTVSVACLSCHDDAQAFGVSSYEASDHPFGVVYRGATVPGVDIDDLPTDSTDSSGSITY
ncbi:MAG: hypothetical protein R3298_12585, partial [Gammaproteobacteria bacterium]|nr:hypothetical protein [Gammaproteobacteria bacterium]